MKKEKTDSDIVYFANRMEKDFVKKWQNYVLIYAGQNSIRPLHAVIRMALEEYMDRHKVVTK